MSRVQNAIVLSGYREQAVFCSPSRLTAAAGAGILFAMRIGQFADQFWVKQFTIRHYVDKKLLLAEKVGSQYIFNENDARDMELILELTSASLEISQTV